MGDDELVAPVGAIVLSARWQEHYAVLAHNDDGSVTVRWLGDGPPGTLRQPRKVTPRIVVDPEDRIVGLRERLMLSSRDHNAALARRLGTVQ
jgi:hypothetical protein